MKKTLVLHSQDTFPIYSSEQFRSIKFYQEETQEKLQVLDTFLRHRQGRMYELVEKLSNGEWTYARILMELLFLRQWIALCENSRVPNFGKVESMLSSNPPYSALTTNLVLIWSSL